MREALFQERLSGGAVGCSLCAHRCRIEPGGRGRCGARENRAGTLFSLAFERRHGVHAEPIEKQALFHFLPGTMTCSLGLSGCNLQCGFCPREEALRAVRGAGRAPAAAEVVARAVAGGCASVCCGPLLDAASVDLKAVDEDFYARWCRARLAPVLETLTRMRDMGLWIEVATTVIPGLNDSSGQLAALGGFIAGLGREVPWHLSGFVPTRAMADRPPTPARTLDHARRIGRQAGLLHVYAGTVRPGLGENTWCPSCGKLLVERLGPEVRTPGLNGDGCIRCGRPLAGTVLSRGVPPGPGASPVLSV